MSWITNCEVVRNAALSEDGPRRLWDRIVEAVGKAKLSIGKSTAEIYPVDEGEAENEADAGPAEPEEDDGDAAAQQRAQSLSAADRQMVQKCHENCGHPQKRDFLRVLKLGKARREVLD